LWKAPSQVVTPIPDSIFLELTDWKVMGHHNQAEYQARSTPHKTIVGLSIPNCILEIPLTPMNARFLSHIDNFGSPPDDR